MTATGWVVRCDRGLTSAETREFADWRSVPLHAAEFERIERIWRTMDLTDAVPRIQTMANEVMIRAHGRRRRRQRARWAFPLAAAVAIMASAFWWSRMPATNTGSTPEAYQVLASTARQVHLPDGSLASLNGDTQIETDFSQAVRHVRLMHGEAHFL
ncbi:MAG: DUF4880 domain-containing protein, partial [Opitutus sp.]